MGEPKKQKLDASKLSNIEFDGVYFDDYPKFVDAYIASASYNGKPLTDSELDELNADPNLIHALKEKYL
jgi:hypothetical protein